MTNDAGRVLENHSRKGLGADEATPSNCQLEGHASSCPKLQAQVS
jgi:hypothetical protein